jgi:hypothetical protein
VLDYDKTTDLVVRTYLTEDLDTDTHPWLDDEIDNGVPQEWWGIMCREGWHMNGARMESAVDMLITEGLRRELHVQQYYLDFVTYGHVDVETGKNLPALRLLRRDKMAVLPVEGWPGKRERENMIKRLNELCGFGREQGEDEMDTST